MCTGVRGSIHSLEIDTNFFQGNYPESCQVCGIVDICCKLRFVAGGVQYYGWFIR